MIWPTRHKTAKGMGYGNFRAYLALGIDENCIITANSGIDNCIV